MLSSTSHETTLVSLGKENLVVHTPGNAGVLLFGDFRLDDVVATDGFSEGRKGEVGGREGRRCVPSSRFSSCIVLKLFSGNLSRYP